MLHLFFYSYRCASCGQGIVMYGYFTFDLQNKYTENLFDRFNWSNCVVAGGLANKITDKNFETNLRSGLYDKSDIDIYKNMDTSEYLKICFTP